MGAGWHMVVASTLSLVIFEWETGSAAGIRSLSVQQLRAGFDMLLTLLEIRT